MWHQQHPWELFCYKYFSANFQSFAFRRIFFRYNTTVLWIVLNETSIREPGQTDTESCLGSLSPPWTVQSLVLERRHAGWDAWVQGCFHFDWGKLRTRSTSQKWHSRCRLSPSASHAGCTLKLWREFAGTQMCKEAPGCKWISFSGCSRWGKEQGRSSASRLFLCKPRSCMCVKEGQRHSGQHP